VQDLLAERLPEFGFEVGFACLRPDRFPALRRSQQTPLEEVPIGSNFDFRAAGKLCDIVRRGGYQIIHAHTPRSCMIARLAATLCRRPLVYHVHGPAAQDSTRGWSNRVNAWIERLGLTGVSQLITVSDSLAQHMCGLGYDPNLIAIVPNGVPSNAALPQRDPPREPWTLGTIALFRPRKGTEVLIDALAALRSQGFDVRLRAVGAFETAAYEAALKNHVERLKLDSVVHWTGFTRDVDAELQQMDVFVLPSLFGDGLPIVVLEAMSAGVPVVATRVQGVPEVIRDGTDGVISNPGSPQDLARAIGRVLRGELSWPVLRQNALSRQSKLFSDRSMAAGVAAAYRRVCQASCVKAADRKKSTR
jgi:glycosyltransferase involved in cell wall biosynthesis